MLQLRSAFAALLTAPLALTLGACEPAEGNSSDDGPSESACASEDRADDFAIALSKSGDRHMVTIADASPAEPIRGDNSWTVMVTDLNGGAAPGVSVDASPWMPDHGHGTAVEETVNDLGDGEFEISPLNLFMAGYWEVTLDLADADGNPDQVMFAVCVE